VEIDPYLATLILVTLCTVTVFLLVGAAIMSTFSPTAKLRAAMKRQAMLDYQQARGLEHLSLLRRGRAHLLARVASMNEDINACQTDLISLAKEEQALLQKALERQIITEHFNEIPGMPAQLQAGLKAFALKSHLADLKQASRKVPGIDDSQQFTINAWVSGWEQRLPALFQRDFLGKAAIQDDYAFRRSAKASQLETLRNGVARWNEISALTDAEIKTLSQVSANDLSLALLHPGNVYPAVEHFIQGIFGEWEPMPDWLQEMLSLEVLR
jgi:hypothetical protein